jgi:hypothetical protein
MLLNLKGLNHQSMQSLHCPRLPPQPPALLSHPLSSRLHHRRLGQLLHLLRPFMLQQSHNKNSQWLRQCRLLLCQVKRRCL